MSPKPGLFGREGFHADHIGSLVKNTLLNPLILLPALAAATFPHHLRTIESRHPKYFNRIKPSTISTYLSRPDVLPHLKALTILALYRLLSGWLDRRAMNNGVSDKYQWEKEIVVITGGSDGIGKEIVLSLAAKKIKVVVLDIQPLTYQAPAGVSFGLCDITNTSDLSTAAGHIRADIGEPTILICNAGIRRGMSILEGSDHETNLTFNVNTLSHYRLAREFLPKMVENNHGMIVTIASTDGYVTKPRSIAYSASTAAAVAFHEGLSVELSTVYDAPKVRFVLVNPSIVRTSLSEGLAGPGSFFSPTLYPETVADAVVKQILTGRSAQLWLTSISSRLLVKRFRSLPLWLQISVRKRSAKSLEGWSGKQVQAERK